MSITRREFMKLSASFAAAAFVSERTLRLLTEAAAAPLLAGRDLSDIVSLDPHRAYEFSYLLTDQACYDTLITFEGNNFAKPVPRLATEWQVSPDGKKLTLKLRNGIKFASGNPLTADVVKWSLERLRGIQGNPSYLMDPVENLEAPDARTLLITLKEPDATFLAVLASPFFVPVDRELIKLHGGTNDDKDKADAWLTEHSAGTGSFEIKSFSRGDRLELETNANAWAPPKINRMLIKHFGGSAPARLALERGEIEIIAAGLPGDEISQLVGKAHIKVAQAPSFVFFYCGWTQDPGMNKALATPKVTAAIKHAMNYKSYETLFSGSVRIAAGVPQGLPGALSLNETVRYDPVLAKRLLAEAGYRDGFEIAISTQTGSHLGYSYTVVAQKVQQDLERVGIKGRLDIEESSVHLKKMRAGEKEFVVQLTWADYPDALSLLQWFNPSGTWGKRSRGWKDDRLVEVVRRAPEVVDSQKRLELYKEAQRGLIERAPFAFLFQVPQSVPYRDSLRNVYPDLLTILKPQAIERA